MGERRVGSMDGKEVDLPQNTQDLTIFVQNLLQQMQGRFEQMSDTILGPSMKWETASTTLKSPLETLCSKQVLRKRTYNEACLYSTGVMQMSNINIHVDTKCVDSVEDEALRWWGI